jgi:hypothetical protein
MGEAAMALFRSRLEREARMDTQEACIITRQCGTTVTGVLVNLSEGGFCLESTTPLWSNERIQVRVLGAGFEGAVRWTKGRRAGGILDRAAI